MSQAQPAPYPHLFSPVRLGALSLPHRVLMAPLTRSRAGPGAVPHALHAEYYRQRASAGLIISEASPISWEGVGYPDTPGIHTPEQVAGWRLVTRAVHDAGGLIACQLWHVGRISHPDYQPGGRAPVSASSITPPGEKRTPTGNKSYVAPRPLDTTEIPRVVADYVHAARCAIGAGFDAVEVHAANSYLIDQFLRSGTNVRTDRYGGSLENRLRFLVEVVSAVVEAIGADRTGVRLSPQNAPASGVFDADPAETFSAAAAALNPFALAFVHVVEHLASDNRFGIPDPLVRLTPLIRRAFTGPLIANGGYDAARAEGAIGSGGADAVSFGRLFISNPDLPARFLAGAALNPPDPSTYYSSGPRGYTDYPAMA